MLDFNESPVADTSPAITHALRYAEQGIPVFPCSPATKRPLTLHGFKEATTDAFTIRKWWQQHPKAMIGTPTGAPTGWWVLDIDTDETKGKQGLQSLESMGHELSELMDTAVNRTASGGYHILFKYDPAHPITNARGKLPQHIDVRGDGGYVIMAGSRLSDGRSYEWVNPPEEIGVETAPEWLLEAIQGQTPPADVLDFNTADKAGSTVVERVLAAQPGTWHERTRDLVARMVSEGASDDTIRAIAPQFTEAGYSSAQTVLEFMTHARTAREKWGHQPQEIQPVYTHADPEVQKEMEAPFAPTGFTGELPDPRPWAYGNFLMYGAVSAIPAPPGVGKTTFSMQLAIAFALDLEFGPWKPRKGGGGKVWLYNGEEPKDELDRRFVASCTEMEIDPAVAARRFNYNSGVTGKRLTLMDEDRDGLPRRSPHVDVIKALIIEGGYRLFVIDPLVEFHKIKENDTGASHAVAAVIREIAIDCGCAVLMFHHTPKSATSDTAAGDMNAMRGGGALIGVARFVSTIFNMSKSDATAYGVPVSDKHRFVRFDDAKANMSLVDGKANWWRKVGVPLDNATPEREADEIGVLRYNPLQLTEEATKDQRVTEKDGMSERLFEEVVRVCQDAGAVSEERGMSLNSIAQRVDHKRVGVASRSIITLFKERFEDGETDGENTIKIVTRNVNGREFATIHVETEK